MHIKQRNVNKVAVAVIVQVGGLYKFFDGFVMNTWTICCAK